MLKLIAKLKENPILAPFHLNVFNKPRKRSFNTFLYYTLYILPRIPNLTP